MTSKPPEDDSSAASTLEVPEMYDTRSGSCRTPITT
eukprot:CAMPEP_0182479308 /NCGR_PEP_ID=MMETSP1319-20130603/33948_1 /TAXON_ID=172717 /ORGANISM="Bolidomonas pacifica, Strain RCC208" /LENGTH=35 /DNA_ID= /DNA_START= /DNA_END= /DNA_ORIENTATION=